jgi:NAD(P)-dependent dehydrogenase (short-subunit alcohol dehydrogenase family)
VSRLEGKVALITGGARGMGKSHARHFVAEGAKVVISDVLDDKGSSVAERLGPDVCRFIHHDVTREEDWSAAVAATVSAFGHLDVLVNNAGIAPLYPSLVDVTEELFDKVVAVNLKGPFRLTALVGARMAEGEGGSIINVSSVAAIRPTPDDLPYAASKSGLDTLTAGFALAYGPKVRVNTIMAGPFMTDIARAWDMDAFRRRAEGYPLRRGGEPSEIAGAALYLASDASSFTTGSIVRVDGGQAVVR